MSMTAEEDRTMTIKLTPAAQKNVDETGIDPQADITLLRRAGITKDELLKRCLNGADPDRIDGWYEYVETLARISCKY
jgi:hypothetical protein